jgi:multicomponent Na+:H+ antiporter subunit C
MGLTVFTNYEEVAAVILFVIGMMNLLLQANLIKKIIGLDIMDCAVYLFLAAKGYIEGRHAPIYIDNITDASYYINPVPSGLVLTGIVVSVSVSALMMALTVSLYKEYKTLNLDEIMMKLRNEESEELGKLTYGDIMEDEQ